MDDWRLTGQDAYMRKVNLRKIANSELRKKDETWHEHCEFCMCKITKDFSDDCYSTEDEYRWVCLKCYSDFKEIFDWRTPEQ